MWSNKFLQAAIAATPNLHMLKWTPQNHILAHKRLHAFITHGRMASTQETAVRGKPGEFSVNYAYILTRLRDWVRVHRKVDDNRLAPRSLHSILRGSTSQLGHDGAEWTGQSGLHQYYLALSFWNTLSFRLLRRDEAKWREGNGIP